MSENTNNNYQLEIHDNSDIEMEGGAYGGGY